MAALSAAARRQKRNASSVHEAVYSVGTGATIYQGGLVAFNTSTKRAVAASAAASRTFLGVAEETKTGTTGGTVKVKVTWGYELLLDVVASQITEVSADVGKNCFVSTDNDITTSANAGTAGVQVRVGELIEVDTTNTQAWVALRRYSQVDG